MDEKEFINQIPDDEPLIGQIDFDELMAELRL